MNHRCRAGPYPLRSLCNFGVFDTCSTDVVPVILPPPTVALGSETPPGVVAHVPMVAPTISGAQWPGRAAARHPPVYNRAMSVSAWDDFPVHQASEWIAHPATSDRNFYDRYYFNAFDTTGEWIAVMGLGQYPNLGVTAPSPPCGSATQQHVVRVRGRRATAPISAWSRCGSRSSSPRRLRFVVEPPSTASAWT